VQSALRSMAKNSELIELIGAVTEVLPNSTFRVRVENMEHMLICYIGGKLKKHKIKVILGDAVRLEVSPYDLSKGRITFRL
jgi:translation initiation factor IF-1